MRTPQKKGPRFPPVEMVDSDGAYLLFPTRFCKTEGCAVQLTSRNRYGQALLCRPCSRVHGGEYVPVSRATKDRNLTTDGRELHRLLDSFLCGATHKERFDVLNSKLTDFALHALMRCR